MLRIDGTSRSLCDGQSRRRFLQIGALGMGGLTLPSLLRAEEKQTQAGKHFSKRSVILIWQHGGPSQLDTFDMKPDAPSEYRGPYQPIDTNVPGIRVSDKMPFHA